ncbi:phosphate transporter [Thecamonas trahens ATCC 50062]|uniref:Phosphate transporter n=1 Tax=Thecamonas trahens ATCC 50062 TaxID=461836 RepID=A0A0L0D2C4_THETB|nr:phosphate transporter [Thecamonas trahens ATCC 50062]KNC46290.1 phosphate transporter [Thecamonas trahens ATCC 50062]|eukprot:XP_013760584.1 phosphate transporter [Thecamonas trahens ATCC 50062]
MDYSMLAIVPVLYVARGIDFEEGDRLLWLRLAFGGVQLVLFAVALYIKTLVNKRADGKNIKVEKTGMEAKLAEDNEPEIMTEREYDQREWGKFFQSVAMPAAMITGIHYYWGTTVPLFIQLFMAPMRTYKAPLVKAYLLGESLPRPFPTPPGMFDSLKQQYEEAAGLPAKKKGKKSKKSQ